ncbi:MAG: hypothetical protein KAG28_00550 [Cocleimonas sp.]|nr:hypothetical protein [Cocleimonas sp.]
MNNTPFKRKPLARWVAFAFAATTVAGVVQAAAPLAGTEIKNLATVSYEDENGNKYTAQSNEAVITVAPQYRATLENDKTLISSAGQTVYFAHILTNIGNEKDTYQLATTAVDKSGTNVNPAITIYKDTSGNGQPDAGEPEITSLSLLPGKSSSIVIAYIVPANALEGDTVDIKLTATSVETGAIVKDIGDNGDGDTDDISATNDDKLTISSGSVLVLNKQSVIDTTQRKVTYTLTLKNTGSTAAINVDILDALPKVDTNGDGTLDTQTSLIAGSILTNGLLDSSDVKAVETDETTLGVDVDGDNATDGTKVIHAFDNTLPPNTTISIEYSINYEDTWAALGSIENTFTAFEDPDGDHLPPTGTTPPKSNKTHDEVPQNYGVNVRDDGTTATVSKGVNDGGDDNTDTNTDGTGDDDIQHVDTISSGDTVVFTHTVENKGNGDDKFNLMIDSTDFPSGTVFTFWNADGSVQLTDSDGDNVPDTGVLGQNKTMKIVVKADLPSGVSKSTESTATISATSSADPAATGNKKSDVTTLTLGSITAPAVDLSAVGATQPNTGFNDGGLENAHDEGPVFLKQGLVGGTVTFPMSVSNEAGSPDSFLLSYAKLPSGWTVVFKDNSATASKGDTITSTPFIPAGKTFEYIAVVSVSSAPAQALANSDRTADVDGHDITNDNGSVLAGADTDKDYVIDFIVTSAVDDTRKDSISHAIDVADIKSIEITPDGQNQIQPGGTIDYPHKLSNNGNIDEAVEIVASNNDPDWNSRTLIKKADGTLVEVTNLKSGDSVLVNNPDGTTTPVTLTDTDADKIVEFSLKPGQYINIIDTVFAPAVAAQGETNTTLIKVTNTDGTDRSSSKDNTNVILGQVRLVKKVALDVNCDHTAEGAFAEIQPSKVQPGQCAIWQITAKNEGDVPVKNVIVNDSISAYTDYVAGSLRIAGVQANPTDAVGDDQGEMDAATNKVTFYLGDDTDSSKKKGGELKSGESAVVQFTVKVEGGITAPTAPVTR